MQVFKEVAAAFYLPFMSPARLSYSLRNNATRRPFWVSTAAFTLWAMYYRDYLFNSEQFEIDLAKLGEI